MRTPTKFFVEIGRAVWSAMRDNLMYWLQSCHLYIRLVSIPGVAQVQCGYVVLQTGAAKFVKKFVENFILFYLYPT